jgi:hypothetical protein
MLRPNYFLGTDRVGLVPFCWPPCIAAYAGSGKTSVPAPADQNTLKPERFDMLQLPYSRRVRALLFFPLMLASWFGSASAATTPILLPIEVMGPVSMSKTVSVTIPSSSSISGPLNLWVQIHGLEYETQASVRINSGSLIALNSQTVKLQGLAGAYGGIGGGFHTLSMTVAIPAGLIKGGTNTLTFLFNKTDGNSSGFRVLALNVQTASGSNLISSSQFTQDSPSKWTAPSNSSLDIAAGRSLWHTATLHQPNGSGSSVTLKAHCADCHTQDGRDLKYFNYSNNTIYQRSLYHGLSTTQANQIVTYIRTLVAPAPSQARPWNPPYQPGPGLDAKPVVEWAAGAGLSAVLSSDAAMKPYVAPTLTPSDFDPNGYLNARELPIFLQLPDWNHWLPRIHPMDAWGSSFTRSKFNSDYELVRSDLVVDNPVSYRNARYDFPQWGTDRGSFLTPIMLGYKAPWTVQQVIAVYSTSQWHLVKHWEIMQEFQLEGFGQSFFALSKADDRAWPGNIPFMTSPNMLHIPVGNPGLGNGLNVTHVYHSYVWYHVQIILNDGNGTQEGPAPIDWGYVYGFLKDLDSHSSQVPDGMLQVAWLKKALELSWQLEPGPQNNQSGWSPGVNDISRFVHPDWLPMWAATAGPVQATIMDSYLQNWVKSALSFKTEQYYSGGWASATEQPTSSMDGTTGNRIYFSIPRLHYFGVSQTTINSLAAWAATIWPKTNWKSLTSQTCTPGSPNNLVCR